MLGIDKDLDQFWSMVKEVKSTNTKTIEETCKESGSNFT